MAEKILVIGGVALGPKAASRCRRLLPDAEITMVDENDYISYGGCGIPYYVSGEVQNIDALRQTNADVIRDPAFFAAQKNIIVHNHTRALAIDRKNKTVQVENLDNGEKRLLPYDKLVIATGATPRVPNVPGAGLRGVHTLTRLEAAREIRQACEGGKIKSAVVVGGGFIGLEAAVALADMWGVEVSVVEMLDQLLPGVLSPDMALMARNDCESGGVAVYTGEKVVRIEGDGTVSRVVTDKREIAADLVIFAAGFIPNGRLAAAAGLAMAPFGAILANEHLRTSDPDIYTGGDCAAIKNIITGKPGYMPLGSLANREGRVIGTNLAGGNATFPGYVGTWAVKLFKRSFCGVGLATPRARAEGFDALGVLINQLDRAHFYPEKKMMTLEIVADKKTRRVLGLQGACEDGDAVKARIDAVAAVLEYAQNPVLEDISNLEVAYAPPFSAAMDAINTVANVAENVLEGRMKPIGVPEFMELWKNRAANNFYFIDSRPAKAGKKMEEKYPDWHSIPLEEIHERLKEIPRDRPIALICNTGNRASTVQLVLANNGITDTVNAMGGMQAAGQMGLQP